MAPTFQELEPCKGMDEQEPGIVVPLKGSNEFIVADGRGFNVACTASRDLVHLDEIKDFRSDPVWSKLQHLYIPVAGPASGARLYHISSRALPGMDKAMVVVTDSRRNPVGKPLKVLVVSPKTVKISIRPALVLDRDNKPVSSTETPTNALQSLVDQMNSIWEPQANVHFQLVGTDPVLLDGLKLDSVLDVQNRYILPLFLKSKDPGAELTMFLVRRALDGRPVNGVTRATDGISLISDDRSDYTMAHEAGHFLGLGEKDKADSILLMGSGRKISYTEASTANKGYTRN
jgi:hypothetical protein